MKIKRNLFAKMVRFRLILILLMLSGTDCMKGSNDICDKYKGTVNVAVDPKTCVSDKMSVKQYVRKCTVVAQVKSTLHYFIRKFRVFEYFLSFPLDSFV